MGRIDSMRSTFLKDQFSAGERRPQFGFDRFEEIGEFVQPKAICADSSRRWPNSEVSAFIRRAYANHTEVRRSTGIKTSPGTTKATQSLGSSHWWPYKISATVSSNRRFMWSCVSERFQCGEMQHRHRCNTSPTLIALSAAPDNVSSSEMESMFWIFHSTGIRPSGESLNSWVSSERRFPRFRRYRA